MVLIAVLTLPVFADQREDIEPHLRSVLDDPTFQTEWPTGEEERRGASSGQTGAATGDDEQSGTPAGSDRSKRERDVQPLQDGDGRAVPADEARLTALPRLHGGDSIVKAFVYVLVAVLVGTLIFILVNSARQNRRLRTHIDSTDEEPSPGPRHVTADGELEELLDAGRFSEAVHLLLQRALRRLEGRSGQRLAKSLTSREILRRGGLDDEARESLDTLVKAVERSLFGGLTITWEEYQGCAAAYAQLSGEAAAT